MGASLTDSRPTLLLTRPEAAAQRFREELRGAGLDLPAVISPLQRIVPLMPRPVLPPGAQLILTSENAVASLDIPLTGRHAWAVGPRTAEAARNAGCTVTVAAGDAESLVAEILRQGPAAPLVHLRGRHARGEIVARLAAAGLTAREAVIYDQAAQPLGPEARALLRRPVAVIAPLFSPRSAALLDREIAGLGAEMQAEIAAVAISPAAAEVWTLRTPLYLAQEKSAAGMAAQIRRAASR
jgi:uroporphyrinogen-III synthase